jgi:SAM-dependent methyltransferase
MSGAPISLGLCHREWSSCRRIGKKFEHVLATDASHEQIAHAEKRHNIEYRVEPAEHSTNADHSVDLITVATAYHWFDIPSFTKEVHRVLKPEGIIAVWSYNFCHISPPIDTILEHFSNNIIGMYWPENRKYVDAAYRTIPFPYSRLKTPAFQMQATWSLTQLLGYLGTWSSVQYYKKAMHIDPLIELELALKKYWERPDIEKEITWDIALLVGEVS